MRSHHLNIHYRSRFNRRSNGRMIEQIKFIPQCLLDLNLALQYMKPIVYQRTILPAKNQSHYKIQMKPFSNSLTGVMLMR